MEATATFDGEPASVPAARRFVRRTLLGSDAEDFEYAATLLVSELATNAIIHAHSGFQVALTLTGDLLRIAVTDGSQRTPMARTRSVEATTGRGLSMVAAMARDWGVETQADGKTVWAVVARDLDPVVAVLGWDLALDGHEGPVTGGPDPLAADRLGGLDDDFRPQLLRV